MLKRYAAGERDFSEINLIGLNLSGLNLSEINLTGAELGKSNLIF
ncbi:pentapeptide repeat-containing protein [Nostoc sp.]